MNSIFKTLGLIFLTLFLVSCSSLSPNSLNAPHKSIETVDFDGLQKKAQFISSRTADLKKYKVREVSF